MTSPTNYTGNDFGLLAGALRGYRVWQMKPDADLSSDRFRRYRLYSLNNQRWETAELVAQCLKYGVMSGRPLPAWFPGPNGPGSSFHGEKSPSKNCTCGIYACHTTGGDFAVLASERQTALNQRIAGVVEGTGRVVVGKHGFRSEKMRIIALVHPHPSMATVPYSIRSMQYREDAPYPGGHSIIAVEVVVAVADGTDVRFTFSFSKEELYYSGNSLESLANRKIDRHMYYYMLAHGLLVDEGTISQIAELYGVKVFDSVLDMLKEFPPISVEHLLPAKKLAPPSIPVRFSTGGFVTSGSWNVNLSAAQVQQIQGAFNIPGSVINWAGMQSQLAAAAAASATSMKELNDAIDGLFSLAKKTPIMEEAPPKAAPPAKRRRPWLKKARRRWRQK